MSIPLFSQRGRAGRLSSSFSRTRDKNDNSGHRGAGYIGSHTLVELLNVGQQVVVLDNLSNASPSLSSG